MAVLKENVEEVIHLDGNDEGPIRIMLCLRIDDETVVRNLDNFKRIHRKLLDPYGLKFCEGETGFQHVVLGRIFLKNSVEYEQCRDALLSIPMTELDRWELDARRVRVKGVSMMGRGFLCANIERGGRFLTDLQLHFERQLISQNISTFVGNYMQRPHIKLLSYSAESETLHEEIGLKLQSGNRLKDFGQQRVDAIQVLKVSDSPCKCQRAYFDLFTVPLS